MIKLVAFDWNGTLFADTQAVFQSDNEVFKLLNLRKISFSDFQKHFDVPVKRLYLALGATEKELIQRASEIAKVFHSTYEPKAAKIRTRANAKKLLSWLSENNIESVIFSNHVLGPIQKQLERLKIGKYFSKVLATSHIETAFKERGKKEMLREYIRSKKISSSRVLVVGDTVEEIEIGKELGAITVAITDGNNSISRLRAKNPDYLIHNLKEVISIIKKKIV